MASGLTAADEQLVELELAAGYSAAQLEFLEVAGVRIGVTLDRAGSDPGHVSQVGVNQGIDPTTGQPAQTGDAAGLYDTAQKMVLISVNHTAAGPVIATNHGSNNLVIHETDHAFDLILRRPSDYGLDNVGTVRDRMTAIFRANNGAPNGAEARAIRQAANDFRDWITANAPLLSSSAPGFQSAALADGQPWALANPTAVNGYPTRITYSYDPVTQTVVSTPSGMTPGTWGGAFKYMGVLGAATPDQITSTTQFGWGLGGGDGAQQPIEIFAEFGALHRVNPVQAQTQFPNTFAYWQTNIANNPNSIGGVNYPRVPTR